MAQTIKIKRSATSGNKLTGSNSVTGELGLNTADKSLYIQTGSTDASVVTVYDDSILHLDDTNNRVGIREISPDEALVVRGGNYAASQDGGISLQLGGASGSHFKGAFKLKTDSNGVVRTTIDSTNGSSGGTVEAISISNANGNVGIGTTSPAQKLSVNGNIYSIGGFVNASGYQLNGTYVVDSSRNLVNIGTISSGAITATGAVTITDSLASSSPLSIGSSTQTNFTYQQWKTSSHGAAEAYIIAYGASHGTNAGNFAMKNLEANGEIYFELASSVEPLRFASNGAATFNKAFTFPTSDGSANQVLKTDGSGNVTWATEAAVSASTSMSDADGDTKIQVEESSDEDKIRFDTAGTERFRIGSDIEVIAATDFNITGANRRINFTSGTGTIRTTGASSLHLGTNNTNRVTVDSSGNVGIGTTTPVNNYAAGITPESTKLAVVGANVSGYTEVAHFAAGSDSDNTGATVRIGHFGNDRGMFIKAGRGTSNQAKALLGVRDSNNADSNILTLQEGGNVGIGYSSPNYKLDISATGTGINLGGTGAFLRWNSGDMQIKNEGSYAMGFYTYNSSDAALNRRMIIDTNGKVGIGTSAPLAPLHITNSSTSTPTLLLGKNQTNGVTLLGDDYISGENYVTLGMDYSSNSLVLGAAVKVSSTASRTLVSSQDGYAAKGAAIYVDGYGGAIDFYTSNSSAVRTTGAENTNIVNRMRIDSSGNVGIGTTAPGRKLTVQGSSGDNLPLRIIGGSGTNHGSMEFQDPNTTADYKVTIGSKADDFYIQAGGTEKVRVLANGNVGIGTTSPTQKLQVAGTISSGAIISSTGTVGTSPNTFKIVTSTEANTAQGDVYAALEFHVTGAENSTGTLSDSAISAIKAIDYRSGTTSFEDAGLGFYTVAATDSAPVFRGGFANTGGLFLSVDGNVDRNTGAGDLYADSNIEAANNLTFNNQFKKGSNVIINNSSELLINTVNITDGDFVVLDNNNTGEVNVIWRDHSADRLYLGTDTDVVEFRGNVNFQPGNTLSHNGNVVLDSSRNLTNIGTVTASGIVNIGGGTSYYSEKLLVQGRTRVAGQLDISTGTGYGNYAKFTHDDTELEIATVRSAGTDGQIVLSPLGTAALTLDTSQNAVFSGTISSGNITTTGYLRGPSTFTIDPATHGDDTGIVVIAGNLQVDGTTTTINSTTLTVDDKNITLASGSTNAAAANGAGITVDCGSDTDATFSYQNTGDRWTLNKPLHWNYATATTALSLNNNNIVGVNNIAFADPGGYEGLQWSNIRLFESPNDLTNASGNLQVTYGGTRRFTVDNTGIDVNGTISSGAITSTGSSSFHDITFDGVMRSTNNANVDGPNFNVSTTNKSTTEYAYRVDRSNAFVGGIRIDGGFSTTANIDLLSSASSSINLHQEAFITFYGNSNNYHAIGSRALTGGASDDLRINSYGGVLINLDSNSNNTSGADFVIGRHGAGTGTMSSVLTVSGEDGGITTSGNLLISKTDPTITLFDNSGANTNPNGTIIFSEVSGTSNFKINYNGQNDRLEFRGLIGSTDTEIVRINRGTNPALHIFGRQYIDYSVQATANKAYGLVIRGNDSGSTGEASSIFLGGISNTVRGAYLAAEIQSSSNDHDLIIATSNPSAEPSEKMRITGDGKVGINEDTPASRLHITGDSGGWDKHITLEHASSDIGKILVDGDGIKFRNMSSGNGFYFRDSANATQMIIDSSGQVGIGTTAPSQKLEVAGNAIISGSSNAGSNVALNIGGTGNSAIRTRHIEGKDYQSGSAGDLYLNHYHDANIIMNNGGGNVGMGTSTPDTTLDITTTGVEGLIINQDTTSANVSSRLFFKDSTRTNLIMNVSGRLEFRTDATIGSTSGTYRVGVTPTLFDVTTPIRIEETEIGTTTTSTTATTQVAIDTFAAATFRSARYTIQVTNSTDSTYHLTEILLIHNGTTPQITEYGTIFTGSAEATFDADISSGNVRLLATPASTDSMTFKVVRHCITV
jgi:hypothetical protein